MNNLSWLLYAADVLPNLSTAAFLIVFLGGIVGGIAMTFWTFVFYDKDFGAVPKPPWGIYSVALIVSLVLAVAIPSKQTIYLIAASEAGEQVIQSPQAQETFDRLQTLIDRELDRLLGEETTP